jgi:serine/threonine protein phosphatase 1
MTDSLASILSMRLYIIGDIHGRADLLDEMVGKIRGDIASHNEIDCLTVTLGDYVDRGPDSRGVLDRLSRNPFPTRYVAIKGNHEVLFESFMRDPSVASQWRRFGGLETLHSYGVPINELMVGKGYDKAAKALSAAIPQDHLRFLSSLEPFISVGRYFLCHAGVRPNVPLSQQRIEDLLWIRDEFLNSNATFEKTIIHGHTPHDWPQVRPNRINIDTGAFATGRLTCLVIDGEEGRFLYTGEAAARACATGPIHSEA